MPLSKEELEAIRREADIIYPEMNQLGFAKRQAHIAATIAERERASVLVEAFKEGVRCTAVFKSNMLEADVTLAEHCNALDKMKNALKQYNP